MSNETYFVTGGTGKIGTAFVQDMVARGHTVRLGTRDPEGGSARLRERFGPGRVEPVRMPVDDEDALKRAMDGCAGGLLVAPFTDMEPWHEAMASAAKAAGVGHLVKVSVTGARGPDTDPPPGRIPSLHWAGEEAVRASGVPSTMIRPTIFAQHFLGMSPALFRAGDDEFHLPTGDAKVAFVDCRDIAICAAGILDGQRADWAGKAFELTGSAAVTAAEIEEILSLVGERTIAHVDTLEAFSKHAEELGVSDGIKGVYEEAAGGWFAEVHDAEFRAITGRHSRGFASFAWDHRDWFTAR